MSKRKLHADQTAAKQARLSHVSAMSAVSAVLGKVGSLARWMISTRSVEPVEPAKPAKPAKPVEPAKPVDPSLSRKATQLWICDPDAAALFPRAFKLDRQLLLQHVALDSQLYTRLGGMAADEDAIMAVLPTDGSQIEHLLNVVLYGELTQQALESCGRNDIQDYMLLSAKTYPQVAKYASICKVPKKMARRFVEQNSQAIQYLPVEYRSFELVMLAMKTFPEAVKHAPDNLRAKIDKLGDKFGHYAELFDSICDAAHHKLASNPAFPCFHDDDKYDHYWYLMSCPCESTNI